MNLKCLELHLTQNKREINPKCCLTYLNLRRIKIVFFFFPNFIYLFLTVLGLLCCVWAFSSCSKQGLLFIAMRNLLLEVASFVVEHRLQSLWLSYSKVCGIYLDQGLNPCPLHWQANS